MLRVVRRSGVKARTQAANRALLAARGVGPDTESGSPRGRRRQPRAYELRHSLRGPERCQPRSRIIGTDSAAPSQPGREPPSEQRAVADALPTEYVTTPAPKNTLPTARPKEKPAQRSSAASNATSPAKSTTCSPTRPQHPTGPIYATTEPSPNHSHPRRPPPRHTTHPHLATRTRPPPQPPAHHPLPTLAHPTTDLHKIEASHSRRAGNARVLSRLIAFRKGPHFCIGAALARVKETAAFGEVLDRLPKLELDADWQPTWATSTISRTLTFLPSGLPERPVPCLTTVAMPFQGERPRRQSSANRGPVGACWGLLIGWPAGNMVRRVLLAAAAPRGGEAFVGWPCRERRFPRAGN